MNLVITTQAYRDLERIYLFFTKAAPLTLKKAALKIEASFDLVLKYPEMGFELEMGKKLLRELIIPFGKSNFVMRYHYNKNKITVIHIWHSRENFSHTK